MESTGDFDNAVKELEFPPVTAKGDSRKSKRGASEQMPYVRLARNKPWHAVDGGSKVTLCNAPTTNRKAQWTKALRDNERLCVNCQNIKYQRPRAWEPKHNEEDGVAKLASWVQEERIKAGIGPALKERTEGRRENG